MSLLAPLYNGVLDLLTRVSAARALNLEHIGSARMAKIDTLEVRLTAERALLLDELTAARMAKIDTLESRLTTGRASNLTEISAARMAKIDTLESRLTEGRAGYIDNLASPPLRIKSIQRGIASLSGTEVSATVTVNAVDTAKSVLTHLGSIRTPSGGTSNSPMDYVLCVISLSSSTGITVARRLGAIGYDAAVSWELVEYF